MRVFATRPLAQNLEWAKKLVAIGHEVIETPLLEIMAVDERKSAEARAKILNLNEYQALIFVSQNAVAFGLPEIDRHWPQLPLGLTWLCVGAKTHALLQSELEHRYALRVDGYGAGQEMNSEALLALPCLQQVRDEKILIFRGCGGRPLMAKVLAERGAIVEHCELYERALAGASKAIFANIAFTKTDVLPVFSIESLNNFIALNKSVSNELDEITLVTLIVPGHRVAEHAKAIGFNNIAIAKNATEQSMLVALSSLNQEDINE